MRINLAGFGPGSMELATGQLRDALSEAEVIITSARLAGILRDEQSRYEQRTDGLCLNIHGRILEETRSAKICAILEEMSLSGIYENVLCLFGGDSSFYSGAAPLLGRIRESEIFRKNPAKISFIPGISSLSAACACLQIPLREVEVFSAHGRACDPVKAVMNGKISFFLTGGNTGPADLCRELVRAGLGDLEVTVCEMLCTKEERIRVMTAFRAAEESYLPLSVILIQPAFVSEYLRRGIPGIEDEAFLRGDVPMTKRFVRVCALSMLAPSENEVCWDLGAGTGSVSVEMSPMCRRVISVEKNPGAIELLEENRKRFGAWNMQIVQGEIPQVIEGLQVPDAIFVGGAGTKLGAVLNLLREKIRNTKKAVSPADVREPIGITKKPASDPAAKALPAHTEKPASDPAAKVLPVHTEKPASDPAAKVLPVHAGKRASDIAVLTMPRIVAPAVTLETLHEVRRSLEDCGYQVDTVQIGVTDVKKRGSFHMMDAQNPVFLISGRMPADTQAFFLDAKDSSDDLRMPANTQACEN